MTDVQSILRNCRLQKIADSSTLQAGLLVVAFRVHDTTVESQFCGVHPHAQIDHVSRSLTCKKTYY